MSLFVFLITLLPLFYSAATTPWYGFPGPKEYCDDLSKRMTDAAGKVDATYIGSATSTLSTADKQRILDSHNGYRSFIALGKQSASLEKAADMNELFWDKSLENSAKAYAKKLCDNVELHGATPYSSSNAPPHDYTRLDNDYPKYAAGVAVFSYNERSKGMGENTGWKNNRMSINPNIDLLESITCDWYCEVRGCLGDPAYVYGPIYDNAQLKATGHFTQLTWAKTRYMGCAIYRSASGKCGNVLVCNYFPAGNKLGKEPWIKGEPATQCEGDRTPKPETGLCGECMSKEYLSAGKIVNNVCNDGLGREKKAKITPTPQPTKPVCRSLKLEKSDDSVVADAVTALCLQTFNMVDGKYQVSVVYFGHTTTLYFGYNPNKHAFICSSQQDLSGVLVKVIGTADKFDKLPQKFDFDGKEIKDAQGNIDETKKGSYKASCASYGGDVSAKSILEIAKLKSEEETLKNKLNKMKNNNNNNEKNNNDNNDNNDFYNGIFSNPLILASIFLNSLLLMLIGYCAGINCKRKRVPKYMRINVVDSSSSADDISSCDEKPQLQI